MKKISIAVDGTAGSGKSSTFEKVAEILNYNFIDTGLMYRAFTYFCNINKVDYSNLNEIIKALNLFNPIYKNKRIFLDNKDVTDFLTTKAILDNINKITPIPQVRSKMVSLQKEMGKDKGIIMVGRDITSVVLPNADLKVFFDCSIEERAKRRHKQNVENSNDLSYEEIYEKIKERDHSDKTRKEGPLLIVPDAWYIDSSKKSIDEIVNEVLEKIKSF